MAQGSSLQTFWRGFDAARHCDEMIGPDGQVRTSASNLARHLLSLSVDEMQRRQEAAERAIMKMGITFTVYSEGENIDRAWPFDVIPRTLSAAEWQRTEIGLIQRLTALNRFIDDIYHE